MATLAGRFNPEALLNALRGRALLGSSITVFEEDGVTPATLYLDKNKTPGGPNPITVADGNLTFWADPADYVLEGEDSESNSIGPIGVTVPLHPDEGAGAETLDDLTDVDLSSGSLNGRYLRNAAGLWVPDTVRAADVSATAHGNISGLTVQAQLEELEGEKVAVADSFVVRRTADSAPETAGVLTEDTQLRAALPANSIWSVRAFLLTLGSVTMDLNFGWAAPAGSTAAWGVEGLGPTSIVGGLGSTTIGAAAPASALSLASTRSLGGGNATNYPTILAGVFEIAGTAGDVALKWGQNTADPAGLIMLKNSFLQFIRIG